jgi:hypothetical protein
MFEDFAPYLYPSLVGLVATIIGITLLYTLYYRPRIQKPLPNEKSLDYWTIWLREHGVVTGYVTTAMQTLQARLTDIMQNETDTEQKKRVIEFQNFLKKFSPIAQRCERKTNIYLCTQNPEDQRFRAIDPDRKDSYILNDVEDVLYAGEWDGWNIYAVKLGTETIGFSDEEKKLVSNLAEGVKYLRDAAKNVEKIKAFKESYDDQVSENQKLVKALREKESKLDDALYALSQKPLTVEEVALKGGFREKIKEWFTWPQILTAVVGYLIAPYVLQFLQWDLQPPATTYFTAFITLIGFFFIPIARKLFGRWL